MKNVLLNILTICFGIALVCGQELPPIQSYTADDYKAGNQNWNITQAKNHEMFFANNEGLVVFNGNDWELYPSPNKTIIRAVYATENRVYSGSYMEFGYWEETPNGSYSYTTLSQEVRPRMIEDEHFWNIFQVDEFVLFQSLDRIYIYNTLNEDLNIVPTQGIVKMYRVANSIYFQDVNFKVYEIRNGLAVPYSTLNTSVNDRIINLFPDNSGLIILTENRGFFRVTPMGIVQWETDLDPINAGQSVYSGIRLNNGNFAIGSISKGLVVLNSDGQLVLQVDQSSGLGNNTVLSLFEDIDGNLWTGLDNGIDVINLTAPIKLYTDVNGRIGSIYAALEYDNRLYLGTNQGLFTRPLNSREPFEFIEGTNGQVWNLFVHDNTLFCGHNIGTLVVKGNTANLIFNAQGTWNFTPVPGRPHYLMQGNYSGLSYLTKENDTWQYGGKLSGFDISARYVVRESDRTFWVNHEYKGVYKLTVDLDQSEVKAVVRDSSLPISKNSGIVGYRDATLYACEQGVYKRPWGSQEFVKDSLLTNSYRGNNSYISGRMVVDSANNLWMFGANDYTYMGPSSFGRTFTTKTIALSERLRNSVIGFENVALLSNGIHVLGTTSGYILLDLNEYTPHRNTVGINSVKVRNNKGEEISISKAQVDVEIPFNQHNLYFEVNTPNYDNYFTTNFRYKLEGLDSDWSAWTQRNSIEYPSLTYGDYTLVVQSRIGNQRSDNNASFTFRIQRPWYASNYAILFYFLVFVLLVFLVNTLYKQYYNNKQKAILEENRQQLELQRAAAEREIIELKNSGLEQDVANKNQELAISTMGIIRKNEVLSHIQKELVGLKDSSYKGVWSKVDSIIKNSINDSDDWQLFEKAFNNADKEFISKIKSKYESLTPNDLKLCAYLRLNLSSKEIAPLLNISTRSVEIRRYRLRKKMNLSSGVNLVEHIMSI